VSAAGRRQSSPRAWVSVNESEWGCASDVARWCRLARWRGGWEGGGRRRRRRVNGCCTAAAAAVAAASGATAAAAAARSYRVTWSIDYQTWRQRLSIAVRVRRVTSVLLAIVGVRRPTGWADLSVRAEWCCTESWSRSVGRAGPGWAGWSTGRRVEYICSAAGDRWRAYEWINNLTEPRRASSSCCAYRRVSRRATGRCRRRWCSMALTAHSRWTRVDAAVNSPASCRCIISYLSCRLRTCAAR